VKLKRIEEAQILISPMLVGDNAGCSINCATIIAQSNENRPQNIRNKFQFY
jgi:hypothetical protein